MLNPVSAEESHLRRTMLFGLLRAVEYNFARGARDIRLFDMGAVFADAGPGRLPREQSRLGMAMTGRRQPDHWSRKDQPWDEWELRGLVEEVLRVAVPGGRSIEPGTFDSAFFEEGCEYLLREADGSVRGRSRQGAGGTAGRAGVGRSRMGAGDRPGRRKPGPDPPRPSSHFPRFHPWSAISPCWFRIRCRLARSWISSASTGVRTSSGYPSSTCSGVETCRVAGARSDSACGISRNAAPLRMPLSIAPSGVSFNDLGRS